MDRDHFSQRIGQIVESMERMARDRHLLDRVVATADLIARAMTHGHKLLICGNGGSAADAQHMAGEFVGRFSRERNPLPALALSCDTSVLTAISNDYSYRDVFSRQVQAYGREGDILLGISTSGNSENVKSAFEKARDMGLRTVLLTGEKENGIASLSDVTINVPSGVTPRIQEMHLVVEHAICEAVEGRIYG